MLPAHKPVAIVIGNRQVLPAPVANWLHRRPDAMADDLVDRLAGGAEIEKVVHCTYRVRGTLKPEYAAVNLIRPFQHQISRARCLLATAGRGKRPIGPVAVQLRRTVPGMSSSGASAAPLICHLKLAPELAPDAMGQGGRAWYGCSART